MEKKTIARGGVGRDFAVTTPQSNSDNELEKKKKIKEDICEKLPENCCIALNVFSSAGINVEKC